MSWPLFVETLTDENIADPPWVRYDYNYNKLVLTCAQWIHRWFGTANNESEKAKDVFREVCGIKYRFMQRPDLNYKKYPGLQAGYGCSIIYWETWVCGSLDEAADNLNRMNSRLGYRVEDDLTYDSIQQVWVSDIYGPDPEQRLPKFPTPKQIKEMQIAGEFIPTPEELRAQL